MTALAAPAPAQNPWPARLLWLALLAATLAFAHLPRGALTGLWKDVPPTLHLPLAAWLSAVMDWLVNDARLGPVTFRDLTRWLSAVLALPLEAATALFATGLLRGQGSAAVQLLPPLPWFAVVISATLVGLHAGGRPPRRPRRRRRSSTSPSSASGRAPWSRSPRSPSPSPSASPAASSSASPPIATRAFDRVLAPILDAMQTVPVFAYLLPILILFGFDPVAALIATVIYAMPPMVRVTLLALRGVPPEIVEFGRMAGGTPRQLTWKVMLPAARAPLMVGVNQVIMLSLNMVIIASMIGAGGLGYDVLAALRRLDIGAGLEAGVAIVAPRHRRSTASARPTPPRHAADRAAVLARRCRSPPSPSGRSPSPSRASPTTPSASRSRPPPSGPPSSSG